MAGKNKQRLVVIQEEAEFEERQLFENYTMDIGKVNEEVLRIKNQIIAFKKKKDAFTAQISNLAEIYQEKTKSLEPLKQRLEDLNNSIYEQKQVLVEKNRVITDNEKKIYELKKTTHELEKFKFVLDHTIKELHREISPKEEQIKELKAVIAQEDERLKNYNSANCNYETLVGQLQDESGRMARRLVEEKDRITRLDYQIQTLRKFVFDCVQMIQDHDQLKAKLESLHLERAKEATDDDGVDQENKNQISYLKEALENFQQNIQKGIDFHKIDNRNSIKENIQLIREILRLRKEIKNFKSTEKIDTILLRKDKKLKGILEDAELELDLAGREGLVEEQEREVKRLLAEIRELKEANGD